MSSIRTRVERGRASVVLHVNAAIEEIEGVLEKANDFRRIPYADVRENIVSMIVDLSGNPSLKDALAHLERHDEYTYRHSIGVALLAGLIGKDMILDPDGLTELTAAAFLHDIGKARIRGDIINKPGKLTAEEFAQMKSHTNIGFGIMRGAPRISKRQALVTLQHHEREDGSGYPYGLKGNQIDLFSKIVAVADVFHAMISRRSYKEPAPFYSVLRGMSQHAYGSLEPTATLRFSKRIMDMMIGNRVVLSDGTEGRIVAVSPDDPVNPLVEVNGACVDLSKERAVYLERIV